MAEGEPNVDQDQNKLETISGEIRSEGQTASQLTLALALNGRME
jgi:hypothetical protein